MSALTRVVGAVLCFTAVGYAAEVPRALPDAKTLKKITDHNKELAGRESGRRANRERTAQRPFAEYEDAKYLLFGSDFSFNTYAIKTGIAKNLPDGVTLVVLTNNAGTEQQLKSTYGDLVPNDQLLFLRTGAGNSFWSRDGLPLAVWGDDDKPALVGARYYHGYEPDGIIANFFKVSLQEHSYYFEGGNFQADASGNCFLINNPRVSSMPDALFEEYYGCAKVVRLPESEGIGHIDERVRILKDDLVATDEASYVATLKVHGFKVVLLPRNQNGYYTYANSLLVNDTIYLPTYNVAKDAVAEKIYSDLGYNVVPLPAADLSSGKGSIHCITMTYPQMAREKLAAFFGATL